MNIFPNTVATVDAVISSIGQPMQDVELQVVSIRNNDLPETLHGELEKTENEKTHAPSDYNHVNLISSAICTNNTIPTNYEKKCTSVQSAGVETLHRMQNCISALSGSSQKQVHHSSQLVHDGKLCLTELQIQPAHTLAAVQHAGYHVKDPQSASKECSNVRQACSSLAPSTPQQVCSAVKTSSSESAHPKKMGSETATGKSHATNNKAGGGAPPSPNTDLAHAANNEGGVGTPPSSDAGQSHATNKAGVGIPPYSDVGELHAGSNAGQSRAASNTSQSQTKKEASGSAPPSSNTGPSSTASSKAGRGASPSSNTGQLVRRNKCQGNGSPFPPREDNHALQSDCPNSGVVIAVGSSQHQAGVLVVQPDVNQMMIGNRRPDSSGELVLTSTRNFDPGGESELVRCRPYLYDEDRRDFQLCSERSYLKSSTSVSDAHPVLCNSLVSDPSSPAAAIFCTPTLEEGDSNPLFQEEDAPTLPIEIKADDEDFYCDAIPAAPMVGASLLVLVNSEQSFRSEASSLSVSPEPPVPMDKEAKPPVFLDEEVYWIEPEMETAIWRATSEPVFTLP